MPSSPTSSGMTMTICFSFFCFSCSCLPMRLLNVWSVPPSSTSACMASESYPCMSGYMNSLIMISVVSLILFLKFSLCSICCTVTCPVSLSTSWKLSFASHCELCLISIFWGDMSSILPACCRYVCAFWLMAWSVSMGLVASLPVGSPILAV